MLRILKAHPIAGAFAAIILVFVARFFATGYEARRKSRGKPGPPHSWILGHLKQMAAVAMSYPKQAHPHVYSVKLRQDFNLGSFWFLDVWPAGPPMIVVCDPQICQQLTVERNSLKHYSLPMFMDHLAGKDDMVSSNGQQWQQWRRMFNPGFSTQHLVTLVPGIIEDVQIYMDKLTAYAQENKIFRLEEDTTRLTVDVIGRVTLDMQFNMQRSDNPCIEAMRRQVHELPNGGNLNPLVMCNPLGMYRRWRNSKIMRDYIGQVLDERFASADSKTSRKERKRTVIDLALDSYASGIEADLEKSPSDAPLPKMNKEFRDGAITQIRTFLFAGHDTTSSTICTVFYLLSKHPACLEKIRLEHEAVLGPAKGAADVIRAQPYLLNKLDYTMRVIKEALRLFPVASGVRAGEPGLSIRDPNTGEEYPTDGWMIWIVHYAIHRDEKIWGPTANAFNPDRFLPENSSQIPEGAWRPFEMGLRNCLGQNLAVLEIRIVLALMCRSFDFHMALDELDALRNDGSMWTKQPKQDKQDVEGEEMYQVLIGTAKPREGMPVRVKRVQWTST